jgi:hypothetical protein
LNPLSGLNILLPDVRYRSTTNLYNIHKSEHYVLVSRAVKLKKILPWTDTGGVSCSFLSRSSLPRNTVSVDIPLSAGEQSADIISQTMFCCKNLLAFQCIRNPLGYFSSARSTPQILNSVSAYVYKNSSRRLVHSRPRDTDVTTLCAPPINMKTQSFFRPVDIVELNPGAKWRTLTS